MLTKQMYDIYLRTDSATLGYNTTASNFMAL